MKAPYDQNERVRKIVFATVYPYYVKKVEGKGRTVAEMHQVIEWLTGFDEKLLQKLIDENVTFETFFERATLNPNAHLIKGFYIGYGAIALICSKPNRL